MNAKRESILIAVLVFILTLLAISTVSLAQQESFLKIPVTLLPEKGFYSLSFTGAELNKFVNPLEVSNEAPSKSKISKSNPDQPGQIAKLTPGKPVQVFFRKITIKHRIPSKKSIPAIIRAGVHSSPLYLVPGWQLTFTNLDRVKAKVVNEGKEDIALVTWKEEGDSPSIEKEYFKFPEDQKLTIQIYESENSSNTTFSAQLLTTSK